MKIPAVVIAMPLMGALMFASGFFAGHERATKQPVTDPQVAAGEWKIEIQTPPCDNEKNLQVLWPKESGAPMTVECDLMPVAEK